MNNNVLTPLPTYDPVSRVVTLTPPAASLVEGQPYKLVITTPSGPTDLNGLRAIDGAYLSPDSPAVLPFTAVAASATPPPAPPLIDYCRDVNRAFHGRCGLCHGQSAPPAADLRVDTPADIQQTAFDQTGMPAVAHGSNTGPNAAPAPGRLLFSEDMPILDTNPPAPGGMAAFVTNDAGGPRGSGDPGHSWLMYKLLMAVPQACDSFRPDGYPPCDGGTLADGSPPPPQTPTGLYQVACSDAGDPCPQPLSDDERARLASLIPGREMPFPDTLNTPPDQNDTTFTLNELELVSLWIAQGAPLPPAECKYPASP